jgi:hypothetical protein
MTRIGILTFHRACNYGAVLQAYALNSILKCILTENDHVEIIDYACDYLESLYSPYKCISNRKLIMKIISIAVHYREKILAKKAFNKFRIQYLSLSEEYNINTIGNTNFVYDKYIVGSDQVWNTKITGSDTVYFLDFVDDNSRKYSYAASFGDVTENISFSEKIIKCLSSFQEVSLREPMSISNSTGLLNQQIHVHIDPSLLLCRDDWDKVRQNSNNHNNNKEKYILIYTVAKPIKLIEFAKTISKISGYKLVILSDSLKMSFGMKRIHKKSPSDFINLIANSECVLTTSFHGVVFSVIYHKNFFVEVEASTTTNYRVINLLNLLNLENRILRNTPSIERVYSKINWDNVENILELERNKSVDYLRKIIY